MIDEERDDLIELVFRVFSPPLDTKANGCATPHGLRPKLASPGSLRTRLPPSGGLIGSEPLLATSTISPTRSASLSTASTHWGCASQASAGDRHLIALCFGEPRHPALD